MSNLSDSFSNLRASSNSQYPSRPRDHHDASTRSSRYNDDEPYGSIRYVTSRNLNGSMMRAPIRDSQFTPTRTRRDAISSTSRVTGDSSLSNSDRDGCDNSSRSCHASQRTRDRRRDRSASPVDSMRGSANYRDRSRSPPRDRSIGRLRETHSSPTDSRYTSDFGSREPYRYIWER